MSDHEHQTEAAGGLSAVDSSVRDAARDAWYDRLNDHNTTTGWRDIGPDEIWAKAWEAALNAAIIAMPGGSIVDPQWVCDELRTLGGTHGSN